MTMEKLSNQRQNRLRVDMFPTRENPKATTPNTLKPLIHPQLALYTPNQYISRVIRDCKLMINASGNIPEMEWYAGYSQHSVSFISK